MNRVFNITEATSLALHAAIYLARRPDMVASVHEIADCLRASEATLSKVMQNLARDGIVRSARGPAGGFSLARRATSVSLLEVYEATQGKLERIECLFPSRVCGSAPCIFGDLLTETSEKHRARLAAPSLAAVSDIYEEVCA